MANKGTAFQWKIFFYFERCENNSNVNTIIFFEQFLKFLTKYDGWDSNIGYEENGLHRVLFAFRILDTLITFVIHKSSQAWSEQVLRISGSNHLTSCEICKLNFSCDSFSIMDSGKNDFEVTIKEALHIKFKKPTINRQLFSQGSSFVLNVF